MTLLKPRRVVDPLYLVFIRTQPCLACGNGAPSDPHHLTVGGIGLKGSDYLVIPLCRKCHGMVQTKDWNALSGWGFTLTTAWEGCARLIAEYYERRQDDAGNHGC